MNNPQYGFTVVLAEDEPPEHGLAVDYIVSDDGVLYATTDHGSNWRCLGMVDAVSFLLDSGFTQAAGSLARAKTDAKTAWRSRAKTG